VPSPPTDSGDGGRHYHYHTPLILPLLFPPLLFSPLFPLFLRYDIYTWIPAIVRNLNKTGINTRKRFVKRFILNGNQMYCFSRVRSLIQISLSFLSSHSCVYSYVCKRPLASRVGPTTNDRRLAKNDFKSIINHNTLSSNKKQYYYLVGSTKYST